MCQYSKTPGVVRQRVPEPHMLTIALLPRIKCVPSQACDCNTAPPSIKFHNLVVFLAWIVPLREAVEHAVNSDSS